MTEHAAVVFVFFFLAEYASIVLMCILISILFMGGYLLLDYSQLLQIIPEIFFNFLFVNQINFFQYFIENIIDSPILEGLFYGLCLGFKSSVMIFTFI
jgi:NADH-ubiquinone oxidoreductase chain 1